jgi:hypothetical protein
MGIRSYIRDRKQVKASRATESGNPTSPSDWIPDTSDWGAPVKHDSAAYDRHMSAAREKRAAREAELAERNKPTPKAKVIKEHYDDSRMRYLGDD